MYTGVVRELNKAKKRGLIIHGLRDDIFFDFSDVQKENSLKKGDRVEFDSVPNSKGSKAVNIKKIS